MMSRRAWAASALLLVSACAEKPEMIVCLSVSDRGGCEDAREELAPGREYKVLVRSGKIPERGTIALERFERGRAALVATAPLVVTEGRSFATNPLVLPRTGTYRVSLREGDEVIASTNVRAPRPSVWNARAVPPAERLAP